MALWDMSPFHYADLKWLLIYFHRFIYIFAVWIEGKQMTDLMKDKERISWLLTTQSFMAMHLLGTCKDIDEEMEVNQ